MGCKVGGTESDFISWTSMNRWAGPLLACALAWGNAHANAQAGATPPITGHNEAAQPAAPSGQQRSSPPPPPADDVWRPLEQGAAGDAPPREVFCPGDLRESRF